MWNSNHIEPFSFLKFVVRKVDKRYQTLPTSWAECLSTHVLLKSNCSYLSLLCANGTHLSELLCPAAGTDSKACTTGPKSFKKAICLLPLPYWGDRPIAFYLHSMHHYSAASLLHHILLYSLTVLRRKQDLLKEDFWLLLGWASMIFYFFLIHTVLKHLCIWIIYSWNSGAAVIHMND